MVRYVGVSSLFELHNLPVICGSSGVVNQPSRYEYHSEPGPVSQPDKSEQGIFGWAAGVVRATPFVPARQMFRDRGSPSDARCSLIVKT